MNRWACRLWIAVSLARTPVGAEHISWFSDNGKTNLDGGGAAMNASFQFELGVFEGDFIPSAWNVAHWRSHWVAADSTTFNPTFQRFSGSFMVEDNAAPFIAGAKAWMFGYRDTPTGSEWILIRRNSWLWPVSNPMNPPTIEWNARDANEVVFGAVNSGGTPFLMKSAALRSYAQWRAEHLTAEPLDGPGGDPDHDGTPNLLEFVFGTPPKTAGAPTATPVALVGGHLQITVPRRSDHPADLTIEVSPDLLNWYSGASYTQTVTESPASLVVRDLTPLDTAHPKRFIRLRAGLP